MIPTFCGRVEKHKFPYDTPNFAWEVHAQFTYPPSLPFQVMQMSGRCRIVNPQFACDVSGRYTYVLEILPASAGRPF